MPAKRARKRQSGGTEVGIASKPDIEVTKKPKTVFKRKALALVEDLRQSFGDVKVDMNPAPPRRGSFECVIVKDDDTEITVWTGLKKGPPRKLKFPESEVVIEEINKVLQK